MDGRERFEKRMRQTDYMAVMKHKQHLNKLFHCWNRVPKEEIVETWATELSSIPEKVVQGAVDNLIRLGGTYMPSLPDLLREVDNWKRQVAIKKSSAAMKEVPLSYPPKSYYLEKFGPTNADAMAEMKRALSQEQGGNDERP